LKFGKIQTSNVSNKIFYNSIKQRTKHGICSVKIWISQKK
jgi:ribosomal protein S3